MASLYRQATGELLGYLTAPVGPFPGGITSWPFKAWVHSDAKLRSEPEPGMNEALHVTVDIPVRNNDSADLHLMVPPDLVDFIVTHRAFSGERR
jgi:hypothetical protein